MSELSGVPYSIYKHAVDCVSAPSASRRELIYVWWGFKSVGTPALSTRSAQQPCWSLEGCATLPPVA
jgi:hypothetical protein